MFIEIVAGVVAGNIIFMIFSYGLQMYLDQKEIGDDKK